MSSASSVSTTTSTRGCCTASAHSFPVRTRASAPRSATVLSVLETDGGTPRRLLVVLSDGFAYDHGYEGAYGEADARHALAEARRRGTGCLCLSIGASTDADALRRVFGTAAHASLPRVEHLAGVVGPLFRVGAPVGRVPATRVATRERTRERLEIERLMLATSRR